MEIVSHSSTVHFEASNRPDLLTRRSAMGKLGSSLFPLSLLLAASSAMGEVELGRLSTGERGEEGRWWETTTVYQIYPRSFQVLTLWWHPIGKLGLFSWDPFLMYVGLWWGWYWRPRWDNFKTWLLGKYLLIIVSYRSWIFFKWQNLQQSKYCPKWMLEIWHLLD